ncbi:GNAT family N-acetyltransferase [Asanoa sp. WMMD1127]|uniref:GNAT family N-acetyltransferase n=1 Tax=Asanoa sp. WMMD1127 TaxID=3016107 RepID=UPI002417B418|nr:GNAT family N-acetyltransferase [Asanoa sp. WMMD1127]MDG4827017.1 GNAT family N-acetyltransferase [Asanoa sp. WMMD1127]
MTTPDPALLHRLEAFYDALPRFTARAEEFGGLVLFVREGAGWPFYARPRLDGGEPPSAADIMAARERQRELGLPEAFEWVHENAPDLLAVARSAGLAVLEAPLMVLDPAALPTADAPDVRLLDPQSPAFAADLELSRAVAAVGFSTPGTDSGAGGPAERDAARVEIDAAALEGERQAIAEGRRFTAVAELPDAGQVASGIGMRAGDVVEIAGVATLPAYRRRGLGARLTAVLARQALAAGADLVFLSASSVDVARVYLSVGFRRVGTACIAEPAPVAAPA